MQAKESKKYVEKDTGFPKIIAPLLVVLVAYQSKGFGFKANIKDQYAEENNIRSTQTTFMKNKSWRKLNGFGMTVGRYVVDNIFFYGVFIKYCVFSEA